jgi:osmotically-inducible protein OsmY
MNTKNNYNEENGPWEHSRSDRYDSPYPGTAIGKGEEQFERREEFSETLKPSSSDEALKKEVSKALYRSQEVDGSGIEVQVQNSIVTLSGSVSDREMKKNAEKCLDQLEGIKDVDNRLTFSL